MNQPQHALLLRSTAGERSPKSTTAIFFHCRSKSFDSPIFVDDERLDEVKSSWALSSRLDRLKKRHTPSATSSGSSSKSSTLDNRSTSLKKKKRISRQQQQQQQQLAGQSRWESLPPSPGGAMSRMLDTAPHHHRNGRPTPPKRQQSIDTSRDELVLDSTLRKAKINESSRDQPVTAYRRSSSSPRLNQVYSQGQRSR